jgi:tetratricopeptide (TPR) repeat protein
MPALPSIPIPPLCTARDPFIGIWHVLWGDAEIGLGHFDVAVEQYRTAIDAGFRAYFPYSNMAAAYALAGKMDEAKSALVEARRINPQLNVRWLMAHAPNSPRLFDGLSKAGLPEGGPQTELPAIAAASATIVPVATTGQARTGDDSGSRDAMAAKPASRATRQ